MRSRRSPIRVGLVLLVALVGLAVALPPAAQEGQRPDRSTEAESSLRLRVKPLPVGVRRVQLEPDGAGGHWYVLEHVDGAAERIRPDEFAARLERDYRGGDFFYRLLNITTPIGFAWVAVGLLGQVLFTGRMVLQWLVSEQARRSVVPVGFWWMSLIGASMLLVYFIWRRDIVGVLGQSVGWTIYSRNLWLIYAERRKGEAGDGDVSKTSG